MATLGSIGLKFSFMRLLPSLLSFEFLCSILKHALSQNTLMNGLDTNQIPEKELQEKEKESIRAVMPLIKSFLHENNKLQVHFRLSFNPFPFCFHSAILVTYSINAEAKLLVFISFVYARRACDQWHIVRKTALESIVDKS